MKKAVLAVVAIILVCGVLFTGCTKKASSGLTIRPGVLMIGMEIGYPPMEYYDADGVTPIGFDVELGKALAAKMGIKVQFIDTAWEGIFAGVDTGRYDCIISSVTITPARLHAHNFSKPYVANTLAMVLPKGSSLKARTPSDLAGLDVAFQADTTSDFYMEELAAKGLRYTPRRYDKVMYCFDDLRMNRADAIVTDLLVAYDYISPLDSPFEIVWTSDEPEVFGICMKKGNDNLSKAVDAALDELFNNGTMLAISNKIFGMDLVSAARD